MAEDTDLKPVKLRFESAVAHQARLVKWQRQQFQKLCSIGSTPISGTMRSLTALLQNAVYYDGYPFQYISWLNVGSEGKGYLLKLEGWRFSKTLFVPVE